MAKKRMTTMITPMTPREMPTKQRQKRLIVGRKHTDRDLPSVVLGEDEAGLQEHEQEDGQLRHGAHDGRSYRTDVSTHPLLTPPHGILIVGHACMNVSTFQIDMGRTTDARSDNCEGQMSPEHAQLLPLQSFALVFMQTVSGCDNLLATFGVGGSV